MFIGIGWEVNTEKVASLINFTKKKGIALWATGYCRYETHERSGAHNIQGIDTAHWTVFPIYPFLGPS